jgi:hypothetical protein
LIAAEFRQRIAALGHTQRGFAAFVGAGERSVRRWAAGEQDIPAWVGVVLDYMEKETNNDGQTQKRRRRDAR